MTAHDAALSLAWEGGFDVILLQEPWAHLRNGKRLTKTHRGYTHFTPIEDWTEGIPRTMTYVRRGTGRKAKQLQVGANPSRDLCAVMVGNVATANVYRDIHGDDHVIRTLES